MLILKLLNWIFLKIVLLAAIFKNIMIKKILSVDCRGVRFYCTMTGFSRAYGRRHNRIICYIRVNLNNQWDIQYGMVCHDCTRTLSRRSHHMPPIAIPPPATLESVISRMAPRLSQASVIRGRYKNFDILLLLPTIF